ncbi:hypothetical protein CDEST_04582 [Colletotrichum destructivum]|uniref:Uncharacterized protein n=1 Tax=Colletotrichum destructivum TaxID=34406 RepID=A0AAX4I9B1_9PEZI|nr:hypothetical protein CDEST_04582 [Colletotrichum destructivum]
MSFPKHDGGEQHQRAAASMSVTRKPRTDQSMCFRLIHLEFYDSVLADQGESDALGDVEGPAARGLPGVGLGRLTTPGGAMDVKYLLPLVMDVVPHNIDINCICRFSKLSSANDAHDVGAGCMVMLPLPASRWCQHEEKHGSVSKIDYNSPAGPQIDGPRLSSPSKRTQHFSVQTIGWQGWFSMPACQQRPHDPLLYNVKCRCDASL